MAFIDADGKIWIEADDTAIIQAIIDVADAHPEIFADEPVAV